MYAKPENSAIAKIIEEELKIEDPQKSVAQEILNDRHKPIGSGNNPESLPEDRE